jgi:hypothetical protein
MSGIAAVTVLREEELMDVAVDLEQPFDIQTKEVVILRKVSCTPDVIEGCGELLP